MKGRLVDLSFSINRKQRITLELEEDFRGQYDKLKDTDLSVEIKKFRKKRSLDANAYAWVLMGQLAVQMRNTPQEIYRQYIPDIGNNFQIVPIQEDAIEEWDKLWCEGHIGRMTDDLGPCRNTPGYHNIRCYKGSSDYDTAQMARLIDMIIEDCKVCGIETMSERELSLLKVEWNGK